MPDHVPPQVRLPDDVLRLLDSEPGIDRAELAGCRARGDALPQSDWDFKITTSAFAEVRERLPGLAARLHPVVAQWDRLSTTWCYMLILAGPAKVDMIFTQPHTRQPAWQVSATTLPGIDDHFWTGHYGWLRSSRPGDPIWSPLSSPSCMSTFWPRSASPSGRPLSARPSPATGPPAAAGNSDCAAEQAVAPAFP